MKKLLATLLLSAFLAPSALANDSDSGTVEHQKRMPEAGLLQIATYLDISVDTLKAELKSGDTLYDIAMELGADAEAFEAFLKDLRSQFKPDRQDRGDFKTTLYGLFVKYAELSANLAAALGISEDELKAELQGGATLKAVAAANGVDMSDVAATIAATVGSDAKPDHDGNVSPKSPKKPKAAIQAEGEFTGHVYAHPKPIQALVNDLND